MNVNKIVATIAVALLLGPTGCDGCASHSVEDGGGSTQNVADAGRPDVFQIPPGSIFELHELPLDRLCEPLTSGYMRYTYIMVFAFAAAMNGGDLGYEEMIERCGGQIENRPFDLLNYSPDYLKVDCLADAPTLMAGTAARIKASVEAGRVSYDGVAALACLAAGRQFVDERGGLVTVFSSYTDAGSVDGANILEACEGWLEGLVAAGGACDEHWECTPDNHCKRSPESCAGSCTAYVAEGMPCDGLDRCADGGECVEGSCVIAQEVDAGGVDAGYAQAGQPCGYLEAGYVDCDPALYCDEAYLCQPLPGDGLPCTPDGRCATELRCAPDGAGGVVCGPPRAAGADCTGYESACAECHTCTADSDDDEGPAHCRPQRDLGESCGPGQGSCMSGYACVRDLCRLPAAQGETCFVEADDGNLSGSCVAAGDFCQDPDGDGSGSCVLRAREGEACVAPALPGSAEGSCTSSYLFCRRDTATATSGACAREPATGEACGDRFDLSEDCSDPVEQMGVVSVSCLIDPATNLGTCRRGDEAARPGDPCDYDSDCPQGHYCPDDTPTCTPGAGLGQICSDTEYECVEGYCDYGGADAGYEYLCQPFVTLGGECGYEGDEVCGPDARCAEVGVDTYQCAQLSGLGGACEFSDACAAGLTCQSGICVQGTCARDSCAGCNDQSSLTVLLFFGAVLFGVPRRWRRRVYDADGSDRG